MYGNRLTQLWCQECRHVYAGLLGCFYFNWTVKGWQDWRVFMDKTRALLLSPSKLLPQAITVSKSFATSHWNVSESYEDFSSSMHSFGHGIMVHMIYLCCSHCSSFSESALLCSLLIMWTKLNLVLYSISRVSNLRCNIFYAQYLLWKRVSGFCGVVLWHLRSLCVKRKASLLMIMRHFDALW